MVYKTDELMDTINFKIPLTPTPEAINYFIDIYPFLKSFDKKHYKLYTFDEDYTKGSLVSTSFQLPLIGLNDADKEVFVFRAKYYSHKDTLFRYIPVNSKEYLILFYLSSNADFKDLRGKENMPYKKGMWVISCLNTSTIPYNLLFTQGTYINVLCAYIPTKSLKSFTNNTPSDFYIKRLLNTEDSYTMYEVVSSRLKHLFESVNTNNMESFIEMIAFQENIYAILKIIFEQLSQNNINTIKYNFKKNDLDILAKAEQLLLRNIKEPPTIQALANEVAMSPTKLKNAFKKMYGKSVYQYYLYHRMQLANQLLLENKLTITEIAKKLGYKNLAHFSRIFKEHFGDLPSQYKQINNL